MARREGTEHSEGLGESCQSTASEHSADCSHQEPSQQLLLGEDPTETCSLVLLPVAWRWEELFLCFPTGLINSAGQALQEGTDLNHFPSCCRTDIPQLPQNSLAACKQLSEALWSSPHLSASSFLLHPSLAGCSISAQLPALLTSKSLLLVIILLPFPAWMW